MSVGLPAGGKRMELELRLAWAGLGLSVLALVLFATMERPRVLGYASFGPDDLKAWGVAVAAFAGSVSAAASALIIAGKKLFAFLDWLRGDGRKKKRRRKKPDGRPDPPPATPPPPPPPRQ